MVERYAGWLIRWRWLVILLTLLWVVAAASGARFLSFTNDYRVFFSDENPQLVAFDQLQNTYSKNDNLLFVVTPKEGGVFTSEILAIVEELTEAAWQTPYSTRVDSITNFQNTYGQNDDLVVENLVRHALALAPEDVARIKSVALNEPILLNRLISPSGKVTGVNVTVHLPEKDTQNEVPEVVAFARQLKAKMERHYPTIEIRLSGDVMMSNAFPEAGMRDVQTLMPLMFVIVLILIGLTMKMVTGTLVTMVVIFLTVIASMGLTGWVGIHLTPPTTSSPIVMMAIVVANCVHLISSFQQEFHRHGDKRMAMIHSLRVNMQPILITNVTTAIGFLSMNFSDAPPFRDLGNIVSIGVLMGYLLSITLMPVMMMILPVKRPKHLLRSHAAMAVIAEFVIRRRSAVLYGMVLVIVTLVLFIPKNELNDEFVKYFDKRDRKSVV